MTEVKLDKEQQRMGATLLQTTATNLGRYMAAAIRYANHREGVTDLFFLEHISLPTKRGCILTASDISRANAQDPYASLDFQACNKYLRYGTERGRYLEGKWTNLRDSENFFRVFQVQDRIAYKETLEQVIYIRNQTAHENEQFIEGLTAEKIRNSLGILKKLTEPLRRVKGSWSNGMEPLEDFWRHVHQQSIALLGNEPLKLVEIGQELFTREEISQKQLDAIQSAVNWYNMKCKDGKIYDETRQDVLKKLRSAPSVKRLLGPEMAAPRQTNRPAVLQMPINTAASTLLKCAGNLIPVKQNYIDALLDSFIPLVDESVFFSVEGRDMLTERLLPRLKARHQQLLVDESVVSALFRKFRGSAAYTKLELMELDPGEREQLQRWRQKTHKNSKTAVKVLRDLRQNGCLKVVASPTDSEYSDENLCKAIEMNPSIRFLVLTMERSLAEELSSQLNHNAVAGKPDMDEHILLFRATRKIYLNMLEESTSKQAGLAKKADEESKKVGMSRLSAAELPKEGSRLLAIWPNETTEKYILAASIGEGGEGKIYTISHSDLVAKIYFLEQLTTERKEKLRAMLTQDPKIKGLCWPQAMLYTENGNWVGYLMPKAQGKELAQTVFHPGRNNIALTRQGWSRKSLAMIAANIASIVAQMHSNEILMGDINPRNFMVTRDCTVYLVDCDSYQFKNFRCPVGTPLYTPPEVHKRMKREGKENYGYLRTTENERYSLAVLLFEILMLGKPPYESRNTNNEDVIQAIIAGDFPYPYRSDDDDRGDSTNGQRAPVGRWRQIWSHMTYQIKTDFYHAFTNGKRLCAEDWEKCMREYVRNIEMGWSSDELIPNGYKVVTDIDDASVMVNQVCEECGQTFNIAKDLHERRIANHEPVLCSMHWEMRKNYQTRNIPVKCSKCGSYYETKVAKWIELSKKNKTLLCWECLQANSTMVTCDHCKKTFPMQNETLKRRKRYRDPILCNECRRKYGTNQ